MVGLNLYIVVVKSAPPLFCKCIVINPVAFALRKRAKKSFFDFPESKIYFFQRLGNENPPKITTFYLLWRSEAAREHGKQFLAIA